MPVFELSPELAARLQSIYDSPDAKGMLRLVGILNEARRDQTISCSQPASEFIDLLIAFTENAILAKSGKAVLEPLLSVADSIRQSERGKKSGRPLTKAYVVKQFLIHDGLWNSISEAVERIKPDAMAFAKQNERAFAPTNTSREIRG